MKNSKRIIALAFFMSIVLAISPIQSDAAVKMSAKKKTLTIGQSFTLKVKGTKKKVKWSSSNKKIATVSSKGKVTAKNVGKSTITAKIAKKKYRCVVTVKSKNVNTGTIPSNNNSNQENSNTGNIPGSNNNNPIPNEEDKFSASDALKNISYELLDTGKGVIAIMKNNNSVTVSISPKLVYYKNGSMISTVPGDSNYAFEPGTECAITFLGPMDGNYDYVSYDDYKLSMSIEKGSESLILGATKIAVSSQIGADNITAEFTNNSENKLEFIYAVCIFYDASKKPIGYSEKYIDCKTPGSLDYATFDFPYDNEYNTIRPDSYEIYVNNAYNYNWNQ